MHERLAPRLVGAKRSGANLEEIYRASHLELVSVAYLLTHDAEAAQDIVHDAFAAAQPRWAVIEDPTAYLRRSIANGSASYHRAAKSNRTKEDRLRRVRPPSAPAVSAGDLTDLVALLPYRQRAAIVLKYYADLSTSEIAAALDVRPGSVGPTLSRALRRLEKELAE